MKISKTATGSVKIEYTNAIEFLGNLANVRIQARFIGREKKPCIYISYSGNDLVLAFNELESINGENTPTDIYEAINILGTAVFNIGGGSGGNGAVSSVNGGTGDVVLTAQSISAVPTSKLNTGATLDTVPLRKTNGRVEVGAAVDGADAINLTQFQSATEAMVAEVDERIDTKLIEVDQRIESRQPKITGLGLSETSFTQAEKTKLSTIVEHFAGRFVSLDDLNAIVGNPGGYAYVSIDSAPTVLYAWNAQTSTWDSTALAVSEESPESIKTKYETNPDTNSFTDAEKAKLSGIASQATKNDTDANLKNRANHTGSQPIGTITDLLSIINSINSANDLQNTAIQGKADTIHTHTIAGVTGLQGALDAKVNFPGSNARIPTRDSTGNNNSLPYATASQNGSVPVRNEVGNFQVSTPIGNTDVANKSYVDASDITLIGQTTSASAAQTLTINIPATAPELLRIEVFVPDTLQSAWIGMRLNGIVTSVYKSVIQGVNNASYVLNRYVNETQISLSRGGANDGVQTGRYNVRIEGTITNVSGQLKIFHGSAFTSGSLVTDLPDISNTWGSAHEASITSGKITQIQLRTIPASAGFSAGSRIKIYGIK